MPFIRLPDFNLHYEHNGQGDTVLLLVHGNFASWRWWQGLLTQLPNGYQAYAPEMRGFGDSDKPDTGYTIEQLAEDLYAFIQALDLPPVHLVGHSLGGAVSLQLALQYPETVQSLSLIASAPAEGMPHLQPQHSFAGLIPSFSNFAMVKSLEMNRSLLKSSLQRMMPNLDVRSSQFASLLDDAARLPSRAIVGFIESLSQWNVMSDLDSFDKPVLVIASGLDQIVDVQALKRMAVALPNAQFLVWDQVGHAIPIEQPEALQEALVLFIEQQNVETELLKSNKTSSPRGLWQDLLDRLKQPKQE